MSSVLKYPEKVLHASLALASLRRAQASGSSSHADWNGEQCRILLDARPECAGQVSDAALVVLADTVIELQNAAGETALTAKGAELEIARLRKALQSKPAVLDWDHSLYYPVSCKCGWRGMSNETEGGNPIADTGDHSDILCPACFNQVEEIPKPDAPPAPTVDEAIRLINEGLRKPDELAAKSWNIIRAANRASTSLIQRRLSIGYNRAARILDCLEERGFIGPEDGANPRPILVPLTTTFESMGE